jgi:chaperonin GroES
MKKLIKKIKIIPVGDRVLIRPIGNDLLSSFGKVKIVLPESITNEKSDRGMVIAVGDGRHEDGKLVPIKLKVGDMVIFSKYSYDEVKQGDEDLFLVKSENILALIK